MTKLSLRFVASAGLVLGGSLLAYATICSGSGSLIGNGVRDFVKVEWSTSGGCCDSSSGSAFVTWTHFEGDRCERVSYQVSVSDAQDAAGCSEMI